MNIVHHVERVHRLFPNKIALIFEDKSYTYKQLDLLANQVGNGLRSLGIKKSDRVALFLPNIPEFIIFYLGILKIGAIAVSINVTLKSAEVSYIINDCAAKIIVTTELESEEVLEAELHELQHIIIAEGISKKGISIDQLIKNASSEVCTIEMENNAPACILYTSGTTGFPKGATLSHENIVANLSSINSFEQIIESDRVLLYLPLFHSFTQVVIFNSSLNSGATIILQRQSNVEQAVQNLPKYKITVFFCTPTVFIKILNTEVCRNDIESVRYCFSAAAPLSVEFAQKWFNKYGIHIYEGYGSTEASLCTTNYKSKHKVGSIGTPIENVEMKVVDGKGNQAPSGKLGEIIVKGPNVMLGYWNRPFETQEVIKNGWFYTGDIGRMDEEGFFYIVDRLKDMINVFGLKVYPTEVENVIYQHPAIAEVAVYGVLDGEFEIVTANIISKNGYLVTEEQIIEFCSKRMGAYKVPRNIKFVDSIPKSPTGKILKRILRTEFLTSQKFQKVARQMPRQEEISRELILSLSLEERQIAVQSYLQKELAQSLNIPTHELTIKQKLNQLGLESLRAVGLKGKLEMLLKVSIPLVTFFKDISIDDLASYVIDKLTIEPLFTKTLPPLVALARDTCIPISFAQEYIWLLQQFYPNSYAYNTVVALRFNSKPSPKGLEKSVNEIIRRSEILRTTFTVLEGQPIQVIASILTVPLEIVDLQNLPLDERAIEAQRIVNQKAQHYFDLTSGPLINITLLQLTEQEHWLLINMHHIITDAWSTGILLQELETLYGAFLADKLSPLPEVPLQYADFTLWEQKLFNDNVLQKQFDYWYQKLSDIRTPLHLLPVEYPPHITNSTRASLYSIVISESVVTSMEALSRSQEVTLFTIIITAFKILLFRLSGETDIIIVATTANRTTPEVEKMLGCFINDVLLRTQVNGNQTGITLLDLVNKTVSEAISNQSISPKQILESIKLIRTVSITMEPSVHRHNHILNYEVVSVPIHKELWVEQIPLEIYVSSPSKDNKTIEINGYYSTDMFDRRTIERLFSDYQEVLKRLIEYPKIKLSKF